MPNIDIVVWLVSGFIIFFVYILLSPKMFTLQARMELGQLRKSVKELEGWTKESRRVALGAIAKHGKPKRDVEKEFR